MAGTHSDNVIQLFDDEEHDTRDALIRVLAGQVQDAPQFADWLLEALWYQGYVVVGLDSDDDEDDVA